MPTSNFGADFSSQMSSLGCRMIGVAINIVSKFLFTVQVV